MAMDRINGSPLHRPGSIDKFQGSTQDAQGNKADEKVDSGSTSGIQPKPADTMEISEAAHRMVDLRQAVDTGREAISSMPDVREDKIALAKKRLEQGFYQSTQVQDEIAQKLGAVFSTMDEL